MSSIDGKAKKVRELLKNVKYSIDYFQREYKWQDKQVRELIEDLSGKFLEEYQPDHERSKVIDYAPYFLGSIIISKSGNTGDINFIVDGQQRLTSLTLLLIYLRNLQNLVNIDELIFSETFGRGSFNLNILEREPCMQALFQGRSFNTTDQSESIQNIVLRYQDIEQHFPEKIQGSALPYFIDWLQEKVYMVEISTGSDDDAYKIFETMNDRGLPLGPTEMLKGYLLKNIKDSGLRTSAKNSWRTQIYQLNEIGKEAGSDFFKAWLRSQYATEIRDRTRGAKNKNFDRIGTEFHRYIREVSELIGLRESHDFFRWINQDFNFFSRQYIRLLRASKERIDKLEHVLYNAHHTFNLQYMVLLAPLTPDDSEEIAIIKQRLVARYIDILLTYRLWNSRSISSMNYTMFVLMRDIRHLEPKDLAKELYKKLIHKDIETISHNRLSLNKKNRPFLRQILARITDYIEEKSGIQSRYFEYINDKTTNRFEIEHILANTPDRHTKEFPNGDDFVNYRDQIGGLLLLPKSDNASLGDLPYDVKLRRYLGQNLLAKSLHDDCYENNPRFIKFIHEYQLPFEPYSQFKKAEFDKRGELYQKIANLIWKPSDLLEEVGLPTDSF